VLGKPTRSGWRRWLFGSVVDTVVREAGNIDIYLMGAEGLEARAPAPYLERSRAYLGLPEADRASAKPRWPGYAVAVAVPALCTGIGFVVSGPNELINLVMVYLLGVMLVATRSGAVRRSSPRRSQSPRSISSSCRPSTPSPCPTSATSSPSR